MYAEVVIEAQCLNAVADTTAILAADLDTGLIYYANRAAERMFRCEVLGGLAGRCVDELVPADVRPSHKAHRERYAANPQVRQMGAGYDLRGRRLDGAEFPAEIALIPAVIDGKTRVVNVIHDMSARKGVKP